MADTTITVSGNTFTFTPGDVIKIGSSIQSLAEVTSVSSTGPMGSYLYDYDGSSKTITVSGALTTASTTRISGYTITTITQQKNWLESLINGGQVPITFESTYELLSVTDNTGSAPYNGGFAYTKCMVQSMNFTEESGRPNKLPFTIVLLVGGL